MRYKPQWNLEPIRPYVSHEQSLEDQCNSTAVRQPTGGGTAPKQCPDYIKSVRWLPRTFAEYPGKTIISLEVVLNECARRFGPDKTASVMAEIKQKALAADPRGAEYWGNKDVSMRRQTICLNQLYSEKTPWFIESIRPNEATQEQVNAAQCNHK